MQSDDIETIYRRVREDWDKEAFDVLLAHVKAILLRKATGLLPDMEKGGQELLVDGVLDEPIKEFKSKNPDDTVCFSPLSYEHFKNLMRLKLKRATVDAARKKRRDQEVPDKHGMAIGSPHGGQARLRKEKRPLKTGFQDGRHDAKEKEKGRDREIDMAELEKRLIDEGTLTAKHFKVAKLKAERDLTFAKIADELEIPISKADQLYREWKKACKPAAKKAFDLDSHGFTNPDSPN